MLCKKRRWLTLVNHPEALDAASYGIVERGA